MTSKSEKDRAKQIQDRCQNILIQLLKDEDNKYCVDCDAKGPRWASWNLGIFLCIRCAGIHRNLGVHISKVKSVNLDSWTAEQVVYLQQMGNSRARAVYEANLPDSFRRPQNDSSLEAFIRAKYEQKKYIAKEWVPPIMPKLNWDKEIDEELEKQKRKKRATTSGLGPLPAPSTDKKYNKSDVIPSIPKPKSSVSPKLGRNTPTNQTNQADTNKTSNGAADLLGLDTSSKPEVKQTNNDDIFSSFFSAPVEKPELKPEETKPDLKTEEENFFKQPAPTEKEKSKLTKDSILALYSQTPANTLGNQFNPVQSQPGQFNQVQPQPGQFNQVQSQPGQFNQVQSQPGQFNPVQPQSGQFNPVQPQNQFAFGSVYQSPAYNSMGMQNGMQSFNQFQPMSNQFQQAFPNQMPQQMQNVQSIQNVHQQLQNVQPSQNAQPLQNVQPFQNQQFFPQQNQLPQQFGGLNLGQSFASAFPPNPNVASNIWQ
ncbi:stromal membrane-associated protein 1 [Maniola hyperantus]|uniref:stromal membrane-associated protein 1 n=1 Tax=Aphantopus hyperantus TaxID=2795564 RepID=UPI001569841E|nr:stromal membrane-associated protein 1 [Maniola hyperantus]